MDVKSKLGSDSLYTEITTFSSNLNKKKFNWGVNDISIFLAFFHDYKMALV